MLPIQIGKAFQFESSLNEQHVVQVRVMSDLNF